MKQNQKNFKRIDKEIINGSREKKEEEKQKELRRKILIHQIDDKKTGRKKWTNLNGKE